VTDAAYPPSPTYEPRNIIWQPQPGPQSVMLACPIQEVFFGGQRGGSKLSPLTEPVCTPKGWVPIGSLSVGSVITDPTTGGHCTVIGVYPQGVQDIYRVTTDDGASCLVGLEHLWAYKLPNAMRPRTKFSSERRFAESELGADASGSTRWDNLWVGQTGELIAALAEGKRPRIPLTEPVIFTVNGRTGDGPVTPYMAGVLLGDGALGTMTVTSCDDEVRDFLAATGFTPDKKLHTDGKPMSWRATGALRKSIDQWCRNHGLNGKHSWDKFIPPCVFTASLEYRLEFLRGLMDTDGTVDDRGRCFFTSVSLELAQGVRRLVWSLGGKASLRSSPSYYVKDGERVECRTAHTVRVWLKRTSVLFKIARKRARCTDSWNGGYELMREVVSVEKVGREEAVCIRVDTPHGLYLTDGFIVTHNTDTLLADAGFHMVQNPIHGNGVLFRKTYKQLDEILKRTHEIYPALGAKYADYVWKWPRGATLKLRYLDRDADAEEYQGFNLNYVGVDEAGNFASSAGLDKLWGAMRSAHGVPVLRRLTGNPGGVGTVWLRNRYVHNRTPMVPFFYRPNPDVDFEIEAVFIPSRLEDNKILMQNDPGYEARLAAVGDRELYKAWRYGDWYVLKGAYFSSYQEPDALYKDTDLDPWLPRFLAIDWGFAHDSAVLWGAFDGQTIYVEREYLTSGLTPIRLAERIVELNRGQPLDRIFLSHDAFGRRTSEHTIASDMAEVFRAAGLPSPTSSDRDRKGSLQVIQHRFLTGGLKVHESCIRLRQSIKSAQRDESDPEDVLKYDGDDALDCLMYLVKNSPGQVRIPDEVRIARQLTSKDPHSLMMQRRILESSSRQSGNGVSFRGTGPRWAR